MRESFGFDYYNTTSRFQTVLRRPLLILFEFHEFGSYKKTHQRGSTTQIPLIYEAVYREFVDHVNCMPIGRKTRERKIWSFTKYLEYLEKSGITELSQIRHDTVHEYIASLASYAPATLRVTRTNLREAYDWMFEKRYVPFSGRQMFPLIRRDPPQQAAFLLFQRGDTAAPFLCGYTDPFREMHVCSRLPACLSGHEGGRRHCPAFLRYRLGKRNHFLCPAEDGEPADASSP